MDSKKIVTEVVMPETLWEWIKKSVIGYKVNPNDEIVKVDLHDLQPGQRIISQLEPEVMISSLDSILVRRGSIKTDSGDYVTNIILNWHQRWGNTDIIITISKNYTISPWDMNSLLLVSNSEPMISHIKMNK